jgi:hypothetical protein
VHQQHAHGQPSTLGSMHSVLHAAGCMHPASPRLRTVFHCCLATRPRSSTTTSRPTHCRSSGPASCHMARGASLPKLNSDPSPPSPAAAAAAGAAAEVPEVVTPSSKPVRAAAAGELRPAAGAATVAGVPLPVLAAAAMEAGTTAGYQQLVPSFSCCTAVSRTSSTHLHRSMATSARVSTLDQAVVTCLLHWRHMEPHAHTLCHSQHP